MKEIFIFAVIGFAIYYFTSCNVDKIITPITKSEPGILRTNEQGQIIGGDFSDWCIHSGIDTFTYTISFSISYQNQNTVARLRWITSQEYNNHGFGIERKKMNSNNFSQISFVQGQGIKNDSTIYTFFDTIFSYIQFYTYRLKQIDIYGNYRYIYVGPITVSHPLNYSFGPAYPNPASGRFTVPISVPRKDTVTIFFINNADTIYIKWREVLQPGSYKFVYNYDTSVYHHVQNRIYMYNSSLQQNDSCRNYGDIQFK